jgi:hypothetical protein
VSEQHEKTKIGVAARKNFPPRVLMVLLLISLPLLNPWVRGDGVGYYAFARALLTQHNLDFAPDYQHANQGFREARLDENGMPRQAFRTATGHLENHFTIGPAILWAPFMLSAHLFVLAARAFGAHVSADGFSFPYLVAMALGTLLYGFFALLLSYRIACKFADERWALYSTIAIWWASSLPVYMYFNPSWSHAHSAFTVALFFWYWLRTRNRRGTAEWLVLALLASLMMNVYYPNAIVLAVMIPEALQGYGSALRPSQESFTSWTSLLARHVIFAAVVVVGLLPTFITRYVVYGGFLQTGYIPVSRWSWGSPWFLALLFSSNHGLFSWTPILLIAVAGIFLFCWRFRAIGASVLLVLLLFYYFMASYPDWSGISSYGNRFFISLTVLFVLGLASVLEIVARWFRNIRVASLCLAALIGVFSVWNLGLIFQWGAHLIPARGPVSARQVVYNQFHVVPVQITSQLRTYMFRRKEALHEIEERDLEQLDRSSQP